jgi:hypothetical protein
MLLPYLIVAVNEVIAKIECYQLHVKMSCLLL